MLTLVTNHVPEASVGHLQANKLDLTCAGFELGWRMQLQRWGTIPPLPWLVGDS